MSTSTRLRLARWLPLGLTASLFALALVPRIQESAPLARSFLGAGGALLAMYVMLVVRAARGGPWLDLDVRIVKAHWVQGLIQVIIYAYWGWYWREVSDHFFLILAQIVFAYAFDALLAWWRRGHWVLGFGQFPIVLSMNLFLFFRDEHFALQFLMIAIGAAGKELVHWTRDGRRRHVFNPSALSLSLFSIFLLSTGTTDLTWGQEIATTLTSTPHMYVVIFGAGLIVQGLFHVTLTTLGAASALLLCNLVYTGTTDVYWFLDSNIPVAVFIGMHLLVTDPATSPRSTVGRTLFGAAYGAAVFALYGVLQAAGLPLFYDKLLPIPLLNLAVPFFDRYAKLRSMAWIRFGSLENKPKMLNATHMALWTSLFVGMYATHFVGSGHEGASVRFWQQAAKEGRHMGTEKLVRVVTILCSEGSAPACNELGNMHVGGEIPGSVTADATPFFARACTLGRAPGCANLAILHVFHGGAEGVDDALAQAFTTLDAGCVGGDALSCYLLGSAMARGAGLPQDDQGALEMYLLACELGSGDACWELALAGQQSGQPGDDVRSLAAATKACELGNAAACAWLARRAAIDEKYGASHGGPPGLADR